jgi:ribA/ribD-fused uncharacterized protein
MPHPPQDYAFFWRAHETNGWATQWKRAFFTASLSDIIPQASTKPITFPTAEHYMMAAKASLFRDDHTLQLILEETANESVDSRAVKALGRQVDNFDEEVWVQAREKIVFQANLEKFRQNEELKQMLVETGDKILVEASPTDSIWGIGFSEEKALVNTKRWGLNLLGKALMAVREELRKDAMDVDRDAD